MMDSGKNCFVSTDCEGWGWWLFHLVINRDVIYNLWLPLAIAVATVIVTIVVNHMVRLGRLKRVHAFSLSFAPDTSEGCGEDDGVANTPRRRRSDFGPEERRDIRKTPSHEFAVAKYIIDLDEGMGKTEFAKLKQLIWSDTDANDRTADVEYAVNGIRCFSLRVNRRMVVTALPFMAAVMIGFIGVIATGRVVDPFALDADTPSRFKVCQLYPPMLSVAFLGAYLSALNVLARGVALFDLSGVTFMRATLQIVGSVSAAVVLWNVLFALTPGDMCTSSLVGLAYPFIFAIGFVPDAGLQYVLSSIGVRNADGPAAPKPGDDPAEAGGRIRTGLLNFLKLTDSRFTLATRSTPLDVIDGIDFFTRFRLVEAGIYEVQNLAVANPILLHIETPYGIYQTIDWVGQAQLCTVVGPERFLMLRQHNIRTVFDLERAVLSLKSTQTMRRMIGAILMMTTETSRQLEQLGASRLPNVRTPGGPPIDVAAFDSWLWEEALKDATFRVKVKEDPGPDNRPACGYHVWLKPRPEDKDTIAGFTEVAKFDLKIDKETTPYRILQGKEADATVKHMVRVIMDDLHVIRLRQLWEIISRRLGGDAATLDDSEDTVFGA